MLCPRRQRTPRCVSAIADASHSHSRQQAGADPGGHGRRDAGWGRAGRGVLRRRAGRQVALRARGRAGAAGRRGRGRRPLRQGPARARWRRSWRSPRCRRARTRPTSGSAPAPRSPTPPRAPGSAPPACAAAPSCSPPAPTCGWRSCTATSTPACASSPRATSTRSCSPPPACAGSAATAEIGFRDPGRDDGAGRRPGHAGPAGPGRRRGDDRGGFAASSTSTPPAS